MTFSTAEALLYHKSIVCSEMFIFVYFWPIPFKISNGHIHYNPVVTHIRIYNLSVFGLHSNFCGNIQLWSKSTFKMIGVNVYEIFDFKAWCTSSNMPVNP